MSFKCMLYQSWIRFNKGCEFLAPLGDLFIRFWVAKAFFLSGLVKIQSWSTTLLLFEFEYQVPFFSPEMAALSSTFIELVISILLALGIGGRIPALILFIFNIMAVISYDFLWTPAGYVGLKDHICWGILLIVLLLHGPGKITFDHFFLWLYRKRQANTAR